MNKKKTSIILIISFFFVVLCSCENSAIERKKINVQINPNLEFINSILLTSKYNEITKPYIGYGLMNEESNQYTDTVKDFFGKYQTSTIYNEIEAMIPNGFTFGRPVELMLSLGDSKDFSMQYPLSELCIQYSGGVEKITSLLNQLNDFSKETKYFEFFETIKSYYDPYLQKADNYLQTVPFIPMIEDFYGKEQNSYNFIFSVLMVGHFGIQFFDKKNMSADLFSVFCPDNRDNIEEIFSAGIIFHEFSHPFINPLTEKYNHVAEKYSDAYERLKRYKLPDYKSGYGDWQECINEHFVRASAIYLLSKCERKEDAKRFLENDLYCGYKYIPAILELYNHYDNNRKKYKTFDEFYPTLLKVFENEI